jgi:hypothetical protein
MEWWKVGILGNRKIAKKYRGEGRKDRGAIHHVDVMDCLSQELDIYLPQ